MRTYSVALHLLLQAQHRPETAVADALHGILTADKRKHAGNQSALIDGAIAGDDIASSGARRPRRARIINIA